MTDNLCLLKRAKEGDSAARERLVLENMGLVKSIARRYVGRGQELDDLIQIGLIGLIKAVDRFDMGYEVQFSTYAVPLITGELRRFLRDDGIVRVSRSLKSIYYRAERYRSEILGSTGREPTVMEISEAIGESPEELVMAMEARSDVTCIDEIREEMMGSSSDEEVIERLYISQLLSGLSENERKIITMRYFENRTQGQIGSLLGMSQVQVSRLEKRIIGKLQKLE